MEDKWLKQRRESLRLQTENDRLRGLLRHARSRIRAFGSLETRITEVLDGPDEPLSDYQLWLAPTDGEAIMINLTQGQATAILQHVQDSQNLISEGLLIEPRDLQVMIQAWMRMD